MIEWFGELPAWLGALSVAGNFLLAIGLLYLRSIFPTRGDLAEEADARKLAVERHDQRLNGIETLISLMQQKAETTPSHRDFNNLLVSLEAIRGDVKAVVGQMNGMDRAVSAIGRKVDMLVENEIKGASP